MSWLGHLQLSYRREDHHSPAGVLVPRTVAHDRHSGPLRVLQRLYPEGQAICHHVLVHPPGGIVGGDVLRISGELGAGSHALITTPGATRFYRSAGDEARQEVELRVQAGARLEWLPLETIAYDGCVARNQLRFELQGSAEMMGWDSLALGLPAANMPWTSGNYRQHVEIADIWLDQAHVRADDPLLLQSGPGWAGHGVLASLWFACGEAIEAELAARLIDTARSLSDEFAGPTHPHLSAGVTRPQNGLIVLRVLAHRVEPAQALLRAVRLVWRQLAWSLADHTPRIWGT
jgi:urease accessory protein